MAYEDRNKSYIELLVDQGNWTAAKNALVAYLQVNKNDYWATNLLALVNSHL